MFLKGKIVSVSNKTLDYANKQDKIVSGQHIKTINGVNIVGPGDVSIYVNENLIGIDSSLDIDSSSAIMNKTVTNKFNTLEDYVNNQDSSLELYIKNQDASIVTYVKNQDSNIIDVLTWENIIIVSENEN